MSLSTAESNFRAAVQRFERDCATLYTPTGAPIYSQEEHAKRKAALLDTLKAVALEAKEAVQDARADAVTLHSWEHADPVLSLSMLDLERAANLRPFIAEYCTAARLADLAERLQFVQAHGDVATKALYARYAAPRIATDALAKMPQNDATLFDGLEDCKQAVQTLAAEVMPDKARKAIADAKQLQTKAAEVEALVWREVGRLDGSMEAARQEHLKRLKAVI